MPPLLELCPSTIRPSRASSGQATAFAVGRAQARAPNGAQRRAGQTVSHGRFAFPSREPQLSRPRASGFLVEGAKLSRPRSQWLMTESQDPSKVANVGSFLSSPTIFIFSKTPFGCLPQQYQLQRKKK